MDKTIELYKDINEHCDELLMLLDDEVECNETAAGRMISQCKWLKEGVVNKTLTLPAEYTYTLSHVSAEDLLIYLSSEPENYWKEIGIILYRLLYACNGELAYKDQYQSPTIYYIDKLIVILQNATRPLNEFESALIGELQQLKRGLIDKKVIPPLGAIMPNYPNFCKVGTYVPSITDLPNGKLLIRQIENLIFNGVRPDSWLTPEDAERETLKLLG